MKHVLRLAFLLAAAVLAAIFITATQGCAHAPAPRDFLTQASHYLAAAQDVEQRVAKVYNALCAERESSPECSYIALRLAELNLSKVAAANSFEQLNTAAGADGGT